MDEKDSFVCEVVSTELKLDFASNILSCIYSLYYNNFKLPVFSKYIIDPTHTLGVTFINYVENLKNVSLLYLFCDYIGKTNNMGCKLHIVSNHEDKIITYKDIVPFVFDDEGNISIINLPSESDKHMIGFIKGNANINKDEDITTSQSYIFIFTSTANIETNYKFHNKLLKVFSDCPYSNITAAIENSMQYYKYNMTLYKEPYNLWVTIDENICKLHLCINHYLDLNKTTCLDYILSIFKSINDIFFKTTNDIITRITDYKNDIIYNSITDHKENYIINQQEGDVEKSICDFIFAANALHGINGIYLQPKTEEISQIPEISDLFNEAIQIITKNMIDHFSKIIYLHD